MKCIAAFKAKLEANRVEEEDRKLKEEQNKQAIDNFMLKKYENFCAMHCIFSETNHMNLCDYKNALYNHLFYKYKKAYSTCLNEKQIYRSAYKDTDYLLELTYEAKIKFIPDYVKCSIPLPYSMCDCTQTIVGVKLRTFPIQ